MRHPHLPGWFTLATICGLGLRVAASIPDAEESLEFRGSTGPARTWRIQRSLVDRWVPSTDAWVSASTPGNLRRALVGRRLVVQTRSGTALPMEVLNRLGVRADRQTNRNQWLLEARDAWAAAEALGILLSTPGIEAAEPVMKRGMALHGRFAPRPDDPFFTRQWHLENRDARGISTGPDLNPRAAWAETRGEGIIIAICDDGFEATHPDLATAARGAPHFDFTDGTVLNPPVYGSHATCVAGLAAATGDNRIGISGVAPAARLASWPIFDTFSITSDERLADMFRYRLQDVPVRNHSWGNADPAVTVPSLLEAAAITDATTLGRGGKGVLMVRSAGNQREISSDLNADGYGNDPRVIAVAAVREDGRVTSYSTPGACVLVAAPSGDEQDTFAKTRTIFTTDRAGLRGYNAGSGGSTEMLDYAFDANGFSGTSASAPMISGLVGLVLSANTNLTIRDVQQVLIHASRHHDLADPDLKTNGAGYRVSHNLGFGVPDAGQAIRLARTWSNRPPIFVITNSWSGVLPIPDAGLRAKVRGADTTEGSYPGAPSAGVHPDQPTDWLPMVSVGLVSAELTEDLHGKAALIERGTSYFRDKLERVTRAGAAFAIIFNHKDSEAVFVPGGTDFIRIPAVMIGENHGRALLARLALGEALTARVAVDSVSQPIAVTNRMLCEHVGLRVRARHARRGDLRLELISPGGTRSILQRLNEDLEPGPEDWTYWSIQHFHEPARGTWTVVASDQREGNVGEITGLDLIVRGIPLEDADDDGLDDGWERRHFGDLHAGPTDDPDRDGSPNAREQALGTDPRRLDQPLLLDLAALDPAGQYRLAWPAVPGVTYRVMSGKDPTEAGTEQGKVGGTFPESEWITPFVAGENRFYRLEVVTP